MSAEAKVRKVLQEIVSERLGALPSSEQNGSLTVRFQEGRIRKIEWHTFDTVDGWVESPDQEGQPKLPAR